MINYLLDARNHIPGFNFTKLYPVCCEVAFESLNKNPFIPLYNNIIDDRFHIISPVLCSTDKIICKKSTERIKKNIIELDKIIDSKLVLKKLVFKSSRNEQNLETRSHSEMKTSTNKDIFSDSQDLYSNNPDVREKDKKVEHQNDSKMQGDQCKTEYQNLKTLYEEQEKKLLENYKTLEKNIIYSEKYYNKSHTIEETSLTNKCKSIAQEVANDNLGDKSSIDSAKNPRIKKGSIGYLRDDFDSRTVKGSDGKLNDQGLDGTIKDSRTEQGSYDNVKDKVLVSTINDSRVEKALLDNLGDKGLEGPTKDSRAEQGSYDNIKDKVGVSNTNDSRVDKALLNNLGDKGSLTNKSDVRTEKESTNKLKNFDLKKNKSNFRTEKESPNNSAYAEYIYPSDLEYDTFFMLNETEDRFYCIVIDNWVYPLMCKVISMTGKPLFNSIINHTLFYLPCCPSGDHLLIHMNTTLDMKKITMKLLLEKEIKIVSIEISKLYPIVNLDSLMSSIEMQYIMPIEQAFIAIISYAAIVRDVIFLNNSIFLVFLFSFCAISQCISIYLILRPKC